MRGSAGHQHRGVDFGINDWATFDNGETIANPRWTRNELPPHGRVATAAGEEEKGSVRYKRLSRQAAKLHDRIGNLRREFLHRIQHDW